MRGDAGKSSFASASMTGSSEWQRLRPQRETLEFFDLDPSRLAPRFEAGIGLSARIQSYRGRLGF